MRDYPHGLDDEILPDDLKVEEDTIAELEDGVEKAISAGNAVFVQSLGKAYRAVAGYRYALGEAPANLRDTLHKALKYLVIPINMRIVLDPYEFIHRLALAVVLGKDETAKALAELNRLRYTNKNILAGEVVYGVAAVLSALVRQDENNAAELLGTYNPDTIDAKKVHRYDRMIFLPLLHLMAAIHARDNDKFADGLRQREAELVRFFSRSDEKNDPEALIDIPGLALLALARKHGLKIDRESVYWPTDLTQA